MLDAPCLVVLIYSVLAGFLTLRPDHPLSGAGALYPRLALHVLCRGHALVTRFQAGSVLLGVVLLLAWLH